MPKSDRPNRRFDPAFTLGGEQAEADPLLDTSFYESGHFVAAASPGDPRCFIIGRTGGGKSAALQHLEDISADHVVRINPEDLALPYVTDLGIVRELEAMDVHLDPLFIALWKHVLLVEVIKHRYRIDSPEAKQNFLQMLTDKIRRDSSKAAALSYLDEFEGRFWCETHVRVREITTRFENDIRHSGKVDAGPVELGGEGTTKRTEETRIEKAERYQRVVNETQLARLNKMMTVLDEDILASPHDYVYVVIDDLDADWVDERVSNDLVRCLFRAVVDLKRVRNLKILVALRTNIFDQLNFGARTGGQEEKFRSLSLHMRWTRRDLEALLDERARGATAKTGRAVDGIHDLLPVVNKRGNALDFILDRTLMRPRDAIAYLNECLIVASGKLRLSWEDLKSAERPYSFKRYLALRDEWKPSYPGIDRVLDIFKLSPPSMDREQLTARLDAIAMLLAEESFPGTRWLTFLTSGVWGASGDADWVEMWHPIVKLLFRIGFLGIAPSAGAPAVFSHDDPEFAESALHLEPQCCYVVHAAFWSALDILRITDHSAVAR